MLVGHANRLEMIIILKANFHQIRQICYAYNSLKYLDFQIWWFCVHNNNYNDDGRTEYLIPCTWMWGKWLPSSGTSSQIEGYNSKWLVCREQIACSYFAWYIIYNCLLSQFFFKFHYCCNYAHVSHCMHTRCIYTYTYMQLWVVFRWLHLNFRTSWADRPSMT